MNMEKHDTINDSAAAANTTAKNISTAVGDSDGSGDDEQSYSAREVIKGGPALQGLMLTSIGDPQVLPATHSSDTELVTQRGEPPQCAARLVRPRRTTLSPGVRVDTEQLRHPPERKKFDPSAPVAMSTKGYETEITTLNAETPIGDTVIIDAVAEAPLPRWNERVRCDIAEVAIPVLCDNAQSPESILSASTTPCQTRAIQLSVILTMLKFQPHLTLTSHLCLYFLRAQYRYASTIHPF